MSASTGSASAPWPRESRGRRPAPLRLGRQCRSGPVLRLFPDGKAGIERIAGAGDTLMATNREELVKTRATTTQIDLGIPRESVGTAMMRAVLHTWLHTGEINAIRQMLGYPEIFFVGHLVGNLEWVAAPPGGGLA